MIFELSKFNNKILRAFCAFLFAMVIVTQGSGVRLNSSTTKGINLTGAKIPFFDFLPFFLRCNAKNAA